jgi:TM2 domain-containing membrane protein YozV
MAEQRGAFANLRDVFASEAPKRWTVAATLAFAGAFKPLPLPMSGLHKFYLGQPVWGSLYLLLSWTQIPRVACALEGLWYLSRAGLADVANRHEALTPEDGVAISQKTQAIASALRELEQLRQEGLISEHEFEQNRRRMLEKLS